MHVTENFTILNTVHKHVWGLQSAHIGQGQSAGVRGNKGKIVVYHPSSRKRHLYAVDTMPIADQI